MTLSALLISLLLSVLAHLLHFLVFGACTFMIALFAEDASCSMASRTSGFVGVFCVGFDVLGATLVVAVHRVLVVQFLLLGFELSHKSRTDEIADDFPRDCLSATARWIESLVSHGVREEVVEAAIAVVVVAWNRDALLGIETIAASCTVEHRDLDAWLGLKLWRLVFGFDVVLRYRLRRWLFRWLFIPADYSVRFEFGLEDL